MGQRIPLRQTSWEDITWSLEALRYFVRWMSKEGMGCVSLRVCVSMLKSLLEAEALHLIIK